MVSVIDFDKREKERAEGKYAGMVSGAEIENACYDHARELAASLRKYLGEKHSDVNLSVEENRVTLMRGPRRLSISTLDQRRYEVIVGLYRISKSVVGVTELEMMDEVLNWLASSAR